MTNARILILLASCLWAPFAAQALTQQIDRIVAIVNDDVITESELQNQLQRIKQDIRARQAEVPPENVLNQQVLERMVTDKIQLQVAGRLGINVSDASVDDAVRKVAARNNLTLPQLRQALDSGGDSFEAFREQIKSQLLIRRLVEREVVSRISVSDEEIEGFLASQGTGPARTKEYDISHILMRIPESATPQAIDRQLAKAEEVRTRIENGMDFQQAAVSYSQAQDALEGGRLGWRKPGQLPALFLETIQAMQTGEISQVLRSPNGFHILMLNDIRGGRRSIVRQTRVRHILIKNDEFLSDTEAMNRLTRMRERIVNGEDFAELAKTGSDDAVSAVNGGDMGWVNPGETVASFEATMHKLEVGEVSEPVRTPFGLHLIQVLDRREQELGEELDRGNALAQIRARKSDERYEQWLRQLRDESFVEYR